MKYITEMIFFFFQTPHHTTFVLRFIQTKFRYKNYIFLSWFHQLHEGKQTLSAEPHSRSGGQTSAGRRKEKQEEKKKPQQKFHSLDRKIFSRCCGCRETGSSEKSHPPQSHTAAEITHRFHLLLLYCVTSLLQYFTSNSPSLVLLLFGLNLHTGLMSFKH